MGNTAFGTKERALLLSLMTLGGSASNPELREHIGYALDGRARRQMNELRLVESSKEGRAFYHVLTDAGWAWCATELTGSAPVRSGSLGRTLYGVLAMINGYLDAADLSLGEFVVAARASVAEAEPPDLMALIRDSYWRLAREPQDWVLLTRLRPLLGDVPRDAVDGVLRRMERLPDVHLAPEADQKTLTEDDRRAAVRVGGVSKHLLAIEAR